MAASKAQTVAEYLAGLPADRQQALSKVRAVLKKHLPKGYSEGLQYGMITYSVPLKLYPPGYLDKADVPLPYVSLASQKSHMAVYLMAVYADPELKKWFPQAWKKSGRKLDMGKSCVRFKSLEDVALDVLGEAVARVPVKDYVALYERGRGGAKKKR